MYCNKKVKKERDKERKKERKKKRKKNEKRKIDRQKERKIERQKQYCLTLLLSNMKTNTERLLGTIFQN